MLKTQFFLYKKDKGVEVDIRRWRNFLRIQWRHVDQDEEHDPLPLYRKLRQCRLLRNTQV